MTRDAFLKKLFARAHPALVIVSALVVLVGLYMAPHWHEDATVREKAFQQKVSHALDQTSAAREHISSLQTLKTMDLQQLKTGIESGHAQSEKSLFESGLSLQEERRLLEKQLEIMTSERF